MKMLDTIRERHVPWEPSYRSRGDRIRCLSCEEWWPCDVRLVLDALDDVSPPEPTEAVS